MQKIIIKSFCELDCLTEEFKMDDNQILLSLLDDITNFHPLKQLKWKVVLISNEQKKEIYCSIELEPRPISNDPEWEFNRTSFCFGNTSVQKFIFLNITFIHDFGENLEIIKVEKEHLIGDKYFERIQSIDSNLNGCREILFMEINNRLSLTFFNCKFVNNTSKSFKIISRDNSSFSFVNCKFQGDFLFENFDNSIIINN